MAQGPPSVSDGPSELRDGVSTTRLDPDGEERFQTLRRELDVGAFGLNLMRLRPGQRSRIHRHERQEEVYLVLEGTLTLEVENEPRELSRGELARVGPAVRRRLTNRTREPLLVLAVGGALPHEGRDGVGWAEWDEPGDGRPPREIPLPPDVPV